MTDDHETDDPDIALPIDPDDEYDPLSDLSIDEISIGSRQLKGSLVRAVADATEDYERGLAVVLWLHKRRAEAGVKLAPFFALTFTELSDQLGELKAAAAADPTAPPPSPS